MHDRRYRTQLCNDGMRCRRRVCFFAHTLEELRVPSTKPFVAPEALAAIDQAAGGHTSPVRGCCFRSCSFLITHLPLAGSVSRYTISCLIVL